MLTVTAPLLLSSLCGNSRAEPLTLYKPDNIAIARENVKRHEWAGSILTGYEKRVAHALEQERRFFKDIVPDLTPWSTYGQVCPVCVGEKCSPGETGVWKWSITEPEKLRCKYCGAEFPNPDYPETGVLDCPNMGQRFTYYLNAEQRAHPDEELGKHAYRWAGRPVQVSFTGVIRAMKLSWALGQVPYLAKLYALTDDVRYAERTAWLLDRLAEVFPRYLYHSYGGCFADIDPAEAAREMGRNPGAGKFEPGIICHPAAEMRDRNKDGFGDLDAGFWGAGRFRAGVGGEGLSLLNATVAYDLTREAKHADGTPVYTAQMHQRITQDLILAGCADLENYSSINNKCGPGRALSGAVGILFEQPERVRRALEGFEQLIERCFHFDGFCTESPAYSNMHLGLMKEIPELLIGYSDRRDYQPETGERMDDFDPFAGIPRYRLALESMVRMLRPDLKYPVIGDTHAGGGTNPQFVEILAARYGSRYAGLLAALQGAPLEEKGGEYALWRRDPDLATPDGELDVGLRTEYFPGWHVGVLRAGSDESRTAFYFNGYSMHGHRHHDTLGIIYHAFDRELASDRGYIWDDPRNAWTRSTLSHNIVTVDGANQVAKDRHSRLELFGICPGVEVIQASANAYEQCSEYRRTCALVRLPEGDNYVVDIFRVAGGKLHQYCFNCNGDFLGVEGVEVQPIEGKLSYLTNLRAAEAPPEAWSASWRDEDVGMRLFVAGPIGRLLVTDAPGWRSYKGDQLNAPPIAQIVAEHGAEADLQSTYTAVMAPHQGDASPIQSVRRIVAEPDTDDAVAVAVELAGRTDYVISSLDDEARTYGPVRMTGRFGFASVGANGELLSAYLLEGTELWCGDQRVTLETPRLRRRVVSTDERTVELDQPLPQAAARPGAYLLTGGTGFEIESAQGNRLTVRNYPLVGAEEIAILNSAWYAGE